VVASALEVFPFFSGEEEQRSRGVVDQSRGSTRAEEQRSRGVMDQSRGSTRAEEQRSRGAEE
jgi:hypothetical protein